jgi:acyl-CoA synthetase (AMP-forming)/AMP-acid ligase II
MDVLFVARTLARRGLLSPGRPDRVVDQLHSLRRWGFTLAGEVRAAAARDPDRPAVIDEHRTVSYRVLLERAQRLGASLTGSYHIRTHGRVAIMCGNHAGMLEAMIACSIVGADAVLVNTALSAPQIRSIIVQQDVTLLIHDNEFTPFAELLRCTRLDETGVADLIDAEHPVTAESYSPEGRTIILTSGTTGSPKGARRPTPSGLDPLCAIIDRIPLRPHQRMSIAAPLFHTWGYAALQLALATRATVVLRRRFDPASCVADIDLHGCASLFAVPVMLQRLLEHGHAPARPPRIVAVSGSALTADLSTAFMAAWGDCLFNLYGSTEASWASIATPSELRANPTTVGRPPHGTRVAIVDRDGRPVPPGQVGEICVGNDMLFEGYTGGGRGRRTRDGLLATGDLGHVDTRGLVYVDGRADDMVVSGGENVFPRPVEDLIASFPEVREVAVVGVPDADFGQRLAAFVVLRAGRRLSPDDVRTRVRQRLARFSVPRDVHFVAELPRTATGKVVPRLLPRQVGPPQPPARRPHAAGP